MSDLIEEPKRWLCRVTTKSGSNDRKTDMPRRQVTAELVYGKKNAIRQKNDVVLTVIEGDAYHVLSGPTAEQSIQEMADLYNREKKTPPETTQPKTRMDGFRNTFQNAGGDALFDAKTLKETISYAPKPI